MSSVIRRRTTVVSNFVVPRKPCHGLYVKRGSTKNNSTCGSRIQVGYRNAKKLNKQLFQQSDRLVIYPSSHLSPKSLYRKRESVITVCPLPLNPLSGHERSGAGSTARLLTGRRSQSVGRPLIGVSCGGGRRPGPAQFGRRSPRNGKCATRHNDCTVVSVSRGQQQSRRLAGWLAGKPAVLSSARVDNGFQIWVSKELRTGLRH